MRNFGIAILAATLLSVVPVKAVNAPPDKSCPLRLSRCFFPAADPPAYIASTGPAANLPLVVPLQVRRALIGGPFAHKWIQLGAADGAVTLGYGPANFPFVDTGQVLIVDKNGLDLISRWHLFPWHLTPAEKPNAGRLVGETMAVPADRAERLIRSQRRHRFLVPYIPLLNDCHTYVCALTSSLQGKSTLPCYLLLKGHF